MKLKEIIFLVAIAICFTFFSCNEEDDAPTSFMQEVLDQSPTKSDRKALESAPFINKDVVKDKNQISPEEMFRTPRPKPCVPEYETGDVLDLFNYDYIGGTDVYGSFDREINKCLSTGLTQYGECCESITIDLGRIEQLPFSTTCNTELDEQEQTDLAAAVLDLAKSYPERPTCPLFGRMIPIAVNVYWTFTTCCVLNPPCPWADDPCDCFEDYPNDPYWGCCQSFGLGVEVIYGAPGPCLSEDPDSGVDYI